MLLIPWYSVDIARSLLAIRARKPKGCSEWINFSKISFGFYNHSLHSDLGKQASLNPLNMGDAAQISVRQSGVRVGC